MPRKHLYVYPQEAVKNVEKLTFTVTFLTSGVCCNTLISYAKYAYIYALISGRRLTFEQVFAYSTLTNIPT